jgi:hypothetical protein
MQRPLFLHFLTMTTTRDSKLRTAAPPASLTGCLRHVEIAHRLTTFYPHLYTVAQELAALCRPAQDNLNLFITM